MRELLPDNMALTERLEALPSHTSHTRVMGDRITLHMGVSFWHVYRGGRGGPSQARAGHAVLYAADNSRGHKVRGTRLGYI